MLIIDFFCRLTERNVGKRLTIVEAKNHPWMKEKILDSHELAEEMKDRLQIFENLYCKQMEAYYKELEECKGKREWEFIPKIPQTESIKLADPTMQRLITECAELNLFMEKQRNTKECQEKLSDDKVNSNSDDSIGGGEERETKKEEGRADDENEESIYAWRRDSEQ